MGCQFSIYAIEQPTEWCLKYRPDECYTLHNHGPSKGPQEHPAARRLDKAAIAAVKELRDQGVSAQETLKEIQKAHPGAGYLPRDIYNARAALARESDKAGASGSDTPGAPNATPDSGDGGPGIYRRHRIIISPEEKIKNECRREVNRIKEELETLRAESEREIERLREENRTKDAMIERFNMFIDICNGRVMEQRALLEGPGTAGPGSGASGAASGSARSGP
jgi:hypothetical protein